MRKSEIKLRKLIREILSKDNIDQNELAIGIEIEREHTDSNEIAEKIAHDHLTENSKYYSILLSTDKKLILKKTKTLNLMEAFSKSDKHTFKGFLGVIEHAFSKNVYDIFIDFKKNKIKLPGNYWSNEKNNGKIEDYMKSKLGDKKFLYLKQYYEDNKAKCDGFSSKYGPSWMFKGGKVNESKFGELVVELGETIEEMDILNDKLGKLLSKTNYRMSLSIYREIDRGLTRLKSIIGGSYDFK